jgi:hypothetical protein
MIRVPDQCINAFWRGRKGNAFQKKRKKCQKAIRPFADGLDGMLSKPRSMQPTHNGILTICTNPVHGMPVDHSEDFR